MGSVSQAAFIVGGHSSELGNANFSLGGDTTAVSASAPSAAVGLTGGNSIFGGNGADLPDTYVFSYTPGPDADNYSPAPGTVLGSSTGAPGQGNVATGIAGGGTASYNVYFTVPESTNVSGGGSDFTLTQDGAAIIIADLNQNNEGTGPDTDPGEAFVGGANNAWYLLGTVNLTEGNTYTVSMAANSNTFVSQRAHAVMWERVTPIPEPASIALLGIACGGLVLRRRGHLSGIPIS